MNFTSQIVIFVKVTPSRVERSYVNDKLSWSKLVEAAQDGIHWNEKFFLYCLSML